MFIGPAKSFLAGDGGSEYTTYHQVMLSAFSVYLKYISSLKPIWSLATAYFDSPQRQKSQWEQRFPPVNVFFRSRKKIKGSKNHATSPRFPKIDPERKRNQSTVCSPSRGSNYNPEKDAARARLLEMGPSAQASTPKTPTSMDVSQHKSVLVPKILCQDPKEVEMLGLLGEL